MIYCDKLRFFRSRASRSLGAAEARYRSPTQAATRIFANICRDKLRLLKKSRGPKSPPEEVRSTRVPQASTRNIAILHLSQ